MLEEIKEWTEPQGSAVEGLFLIVEVSMYFQIDNMKKLTKRQENDLLTIRYFIPSLLNDIEITDNDIESFFDFSERGKEPTKISEGYNVLLEGKRWRGIHMRMYEDGILDGSVPYRMLFNTEELMPRPIVDFMKKEMFKGIDYNLIENIYQNSL